MDIPLSQRASAGTQPRLMIQVPGLSQAYSDLKQGRSKLWYNLVLIPSYVALASAVILVLHACFASRRVQKFWSKIVRRDIHDAQDDERTSAPRSDSDLTNDFVRHIVDQHGGSTIFCFQVLRALGCLTLLVLSVYTAIQDEGSIVGLFGKKGRHRKKHRHGHQPPLSDKEWIDLLLTMTFFYTFALASLAIASTSKWARIIICHLNTVLLAFCGVYAYRDLVPLALVNGVPADKAEGSLLWAKIGALICSAIVIPLVVPRRYVPVDPNSPTPEPNPEQTASLLSFHTYSFLDPIIKLASRTPSLKAEQLPPLSDYDRARVLKARAFPHIDAFVNKRKPHIFFGLIRVFRAQFVSVVLSLIIFNIAAFTSPFAIKNLLQYLETGGRESTVKPWFWIAWLFLGPYIANTAHQNYFWVATHTRVQIECLITQLLFEHSLRIRVKAETSDSEEHIKLNAFAQSQGATKGTLDPSNKVGPPTKDKGTTSAANNFTGKVNSLITTDLNNIAATVDFPLLLVHIPLQIGLSVAFLYWILGWSALIGMGVMVMCLPLPGFIAKFVKRLQVERMKKTDARVGRVSDTISILRMVKLFGWERKMTQKIAEKRDEELSLIWKRRKLAVISEIVNYLIPLSVMLTTYAFFTLVMKKELTAAIVFSSISVFENFERQLGMTFIYVDRAIAGWVSLGRVNQFLQTTELLDAFSETGVPSTINTREDAESEVIGFHNASFAWSSDCHEGSTTPSRRRFILRIDGDLFFPRGQVSLVVGPTASGKTSLLMALLGEMHFIPTRLDSWFKSPRAGGVAYAAQESWVQNETIKDNILFGAPYEEERYNKVIHQCALAQDLSLFEAGDQTEVGEKGITLSGGQKARLTLARSVYSKAEILLLDDILAALDAHTSKRVVEKCLAGDLVRGRTVIMVTHSVSLASTIAQHAVSLGRNGEVSAQGSISDVLKNSKAFIEELESTSQLVEKAEEEVDSSASQPKPTDGKLMVAEEVEVGRVGWGSFKMFFTAFGGRFGLTVIVVHVLLMVLYEVVYTGEAWFLGYWASQYAMYPPSKVPVVRNLGVYSSLLVSGAIIYAMAFLVFARGSIRASRVIHAGLVDAVIGTTMRWLDSTPVSRILTRCTQDMNTIDEVLPSHVRWLIGMTVTILVKFTAVIALTPAFLLPGVFVALGGGYCGQLYMKAQLPIKREMSNAKQPVLGHFGAAISGLVSLRAYGAQEAFILRSQSQIDRYSKAARYNYDLNRWVNLRANALGSLFASTLAGYLVYFQDHTASNTGFSLTMAVAFSSEILWWIRTLNECEVEGNSLERIAQYISVEQEEKPTERGVPPAYWPADGTLQVKDLSARYSVDGPNVLHDISFEIKSGERIGIVGRTGSGKSSLTLALLRAIPTEGTVMYAGIDTSQLNLDALRTNLTIIPQMPELLSGSLRQNLDPFDQYDDATLNSALTSAGLFSLQDKNDEDRITLDTAIASGGGNLSVGQRQIIALARAIVRGSKLLILDEATSAIDHETDSVIQSSLRNKLGGDVTVLTVAHRLQTIMDSDKIMVLESGRIAEFDKPSSLLKKPNSKLRALVNESGDKEGLISMASDEA